MKKTFLAAAASALLVSATAAADDGAAAVDTARRAIAMGHGAECSLDMRPVEQGGYYPCIDISPYRIVFAYGAVKAFVIQKDRTPYPIMDSPQDTPVFLRDGPWKADMPARVALWWSDNVEGGARRLQETKERSENQKSAEDYVNKLRGKTDSPALDRPAQAAPTPTPKPTPTDTLDVDDDIRKILEN